MTVAERATCCLHALVGKPRGLSDEDQALPLSSSFVEEQLEILRTHSDQLIWTISQTQAARGKIKR